MIIRNSPARWFVATAMFASLVSPALAADDPLLNDPRKKVSYCVGLSIASNWKGQDLDFDVEAVARGISDQLSGKALLNEADTRQVMVAFQTEHRAKLEEKRKAQGDKNLAEGKAFLEANKAKPGVVTLPSGLQYKILTEGKGEIPKSTDKVSCHYRGTLVDGTEFDSSYKSSKPAEFEVTRVVKGWTEALQLMKVGSKWQLFVPAELAYGVRGYGAKIAPNAALIFDLELLSTMSAPAPAASLPPGTPQPVVTSDIIKVPSADEIKKGAKIEVIKADDVERIQKEREQKDEKK